MDEDINKIEPQNFNLIIGVIILSFALLVIAYFGQFNDAFIGWLQYAATIYILGSFRKYLRNFAASSAIYWLNWNIGIVAVTAIIRLAAGTYYKFINIEAIPVHHRSSGALSYFFAIIYCISFLVVIFNFGKALRKIENDFVGLLNMLGSLILYITRIFIFVPLILAMLNIREFGFLFWIAVTIISAIPIIIMAIIFYKAKKYQEKILS